MRAFIPSALLLLLSSINPAQATEYIYRDIMANTLPSAQCNVENVAKAVSSRDVNLNRYAKRFCLMQGYGWHLDAIKTAGDTVCTSCPSNQSQQKCLQQDMVVTCKRIKPGTVGMLPGKG